MHPFHVDFVVVLVRTNPFDPNDALLEVDGDDQPIVIPLDVEHDPISRHDAGCRIAPLHLGAARPAGLPNLIEPGIQCGFQSPLVLGTPATPDEFLQRAPGDNPHGQDHIMRPNWAQEGPLTP